jgi:two-component system chemotaxis response regulator CheB
MEALQTLVSGLPTDLQASVFVVVHIPPPIPSNLPRIINLNCNGCLPALHPHEGEPIKRGHIYIAPPDYHLLVENGHIRLWRGPKENRFRPAVNALFRSAAFEYRDRVIGIVLSGALDDGSTGLWWVKHFGGLAIVQDPSDAMFPDMPRNALAHVRADYVVPSVEMGPLLADLARGRSHIFPEH